MKPCYLLLACGLAAVVGCTSQVIRPQSPEADDDPAEVEVKFIGDLVRSYGMNYLKVESVSLVTGLEGTGEDPPLTPQRSAVMSEMEHRGVASPEKVLESRDTAVVVVRGFLRPGIQKGDRFDVELRVPTRSETESLRSGWLLESRLTEMAVLGNRIREGHLMGIAAGPVMVDPTAEGEGDRVHLTRGRVLGGGVSLKSRTLGLMLHEEHQSIRVSKQIGQALNQRFHTYVRGTKKGVATPKTDKFVELVVHPRYKDNVSRFMRVVKNVAYRSSQKTDQKRLQILQRQLLDPVTTSIAALRLEAVGGKQAVEALKKGLASEEPEVRFYSAESLAYLDEIVAAKALGEAAGKEPAFRVFALTALSALDDVTAREELTALLSATSAETRYGAFRALWAANHDDPLIAGDLLADQFHYHVLDTGGPEMIHVTRSLRPEVVLFGSQQMFKLPMLLDAGKHITITGRPNGEVTVSRFAVGQPDQKRVVTAGVDDVIRAIVELGGTYPDVVQALDEAKRNGALVGRFKIDALPKTGRRFQRDDQGEEDEPQARFSVPGPLPDLFTPWRKS